MTWDREGVVAAFYDAVKGQACVVERRESDWSFQFGTAWVGGTALWRVIENRRVALTSDDDGHWFGLSQPVDAEARANAILGRRMVERAEIDRDTGDLEVNFSGGVRLDLIHNSTGYEARQGGFAFKDHRVQLIAGGGGDLSYTGVQLGSHPSATLGTPLPR